MVQPVEGLLAPPRCNSNGGNPEAYEEYVFLKFCAKPTSDSSFVELCKNLGKALEGAGGRTFNSQIQQVLEHVDVTAAVRELKQPRSATPRISPIVFSPDFEALYTLPRNEPDRPQIIRRMIGHGAIWYFDREGARD